jgi:hypothetical protein
MLLAAVLSATGVVLPANTPFAGTWKVNLEKVGIWASFQIAGGCGSIEPLLLSLRQIPVLG